MTATRYYRLPADLGELTAGDEHGQLVADILEVQVIQQWRAGELVDESRTVIPTGRRAIALEAAR